jgi:GNAT superfamily N-acetyltransferase
MPDLTQVVREAVPCDAPGIARIHVDAWQRAYRGLMPQALLDELSVDQRERMWDGHLADDSGPATFVAVVDGAIAGFCSIAVPARDADSSATTGEIAALYVDPARWRSGVGTALMARALDELRACEDVTLWVLAGNEPALAFYARFGFAPDGRIARGETSGQDELRMRASTR